MVGIPSYAEWQKALSGLGSLQKRVLQIFASMTPAVDRRLIQLILERTVGNPGSFKFLDFDKPEIEVWSTSSLINSSFYDDSEINATSFHNSDLPISFLDLSSRALNSLQTAGIESVDSLTRISEQDLIGIDGVGKKVAEEIIKQLTEKGLFLMVMGDSPSKQKHNEEIRLKALRISKREFANRKTGRPNIARNQYWLGTPEGKSFVEVFGREPSKNDTRNLSKALDRLEGRGVLLHSNKLTMTNQKTWKVQLTPLGVEVTSQLLLTEILRS